MRRWLAVAVEQHLHEEDEIIYLYYWQAECGQANLSLLLLSSVTQTPSSTIIPTARISDVHLHCMIRTVKSRPHTPNKPNTHNGDC